MYCASVVTFLRPVSQATMMSSRSNAGQLRRVALIMSAVFVLAATAVPAVGAQGQDTAEALPSVRPAARLTAAARGVFGYGNKVAAEDDFDIPVHFHVVGRQDASTRNVFINDVSNAKLMRQLAVSAEFPAPYELYIFFAWLAVLVGLRSSAPLPVHAWSAVNERWRLRTSGIHSTFRFS